LVFNLLYAEEVQVGDYLQGKNGEWGVVRVINVAGLDFSIPWIGFGLVGRVEESVDFHPRAIVFVGVDEKCRGIGRFLSPG